MEDLLLSDEQFTEEERLTRDSVAQFLRKEIEPELMQAFEAGTELLVEARPADRGRLAQHMKAIGEPDIDVEGNQDDVKD